MGTSTCTQESVAIGITSGQRQKRNPRADRTRRPTRAPHHVALLLLRDSIALRYGAPHEGGDPAHQPQPAPAGRKPEAAHHVRHQRPPPPRRLWTCLGPDLNWMCQFWPGLKWICQFWTIAGRAALVPKL